jgi:hypothetical protein
MDVRTSGAGRAGGRHHHGFVVPVSVKIEVLKIVDINAFAVRALAEVFLDLVFGNLRRSPLCQRQERR